MEPFTKPLVSRRRYELDWLRVVTITVMFFFHSNRVMRSTHQSRPAQRPGEFAGLSGPTKDTAPTPIVSP